MNGSTKRLGLALLFVLILGSLIGYGILQRGGNAEDILTMKGVDVCTTARDFNTGAHRCPDSSSQITTCDEAKSAIALLQGVTLASADNQLLPTASSSAPECELKTISQPDDLYAIVFHAYYSDSASPTTSTVRTAAVNTLYDTYGNFYQGFSWIDLASPTPSPSITPQASYQPFTTAFLVRGEPGFKMSVTLQDMYGQSHPGAGVLIRVSCGSSQDTMVAEPSGVSWFSFAGYEKLNCGDQPLTAQAIVEKDSGGLWVKGTPSYSYLFEPPIPVSITFQNRPQPVETSFLGKMQALGVSVQVTSKDVFGQTSLSPIVKTPVTFSCTQDGLITFNNALSATTDKKGRAFVSLADAQNTLPGCQATNFSATLTDYNTKTGAPKDSPLYDYYVASPGPVPVGQISGAIFTGASLVANELEVGGRVRLNDVGNTPGGFLTAGSQVCIFYTLEAAKAFPNGCPSGKTSTSLTIRSDQRGQYLFGDGSNSQLSYGDYLQSGSGPVELRVVNYQNKSYAESLIDANQIALDPGSLNLKDIHLPTATQKDLQDQVCLTVQQIWSTKECAPLFNIIDHESRWDVSATNSSSEACGLFQANPCDKYEETVLPDEISGSIGNQIRWGAAYVKGRYTTPSAAWKHWQANDNY